MKKKKKIRLPFKSMLFIKKWQLYYFFFFSQCWSGRSCSTLSARGPRSKPQAWRPAADAQTPRRNSPGSPPPRQARWTLRHHEATFSWTCSSAVRSESEEERTGRGEQQSWRKEVSHTLILLCLPLFLMPLFKESHGVQTVPRSAPRSTARLAATQNAPSACVNQQPYIDLGHNLLCAPFGFTRKERKHTQVMDERKDKPTGGEMINQRYWCCASGEKWDSSTVSLTEPQSNSTCYTLTAPCDLVPLRNVSEH